jgi:hypothetical protein
VSREGERVLWACIAIWLLVQFAAVARLPGLADDHSLRAAAGRMESSADAFGVKALPPRPLQHLTFYLGDQIGPAGFAVQRGLNVLFLGVAIAMVAALARQAGLDAGAACLAALLFACFPTGRAVWWPAAVSAPARTAATLVTMWCFARGTPLAGAGAVAALVFALCAHQSALLVPGLCLMWVAAREPSLAGGLRAGLRAMLRPAFVGMALAVLIALWFYKRVPDPHLGVRSLGSIAANAVWASVWWWPEWLRVWAIDGLRGIHGGFAAIGACALILAAFAWIGWLCWRGGSLTRFAILAAAIDLSLPALSAGRSLRYAMLAASFAAVALASSKPGRLQRLLLLLLIACWSFDSLHTLWEFRSASELSGRLVQQAADVRRNTPDELPVYVLDVPAVFGREQDIALANWGLAEAVAELGATGPLRMVRTQPHRTSSASAPIDPATADQLRETAVVLEYDPAAKAFSIWEQGQVRTR